jgi:hypothetical protein
MLASIKSTNINTQQINSTQSIKYKTDKLNKAQIIKKIKTKQVTEKGSKCPTKVILHLR